MSSDQPGPYARSGASTAPGGDDGDDDGHGGGSSGASGSGASEGGGSEGRGSEGRGSEGRGSGSSGAGKSGSGKRGRTIGVVVGVLVLVAAGVGGYLLFGPGAQTSYRLSTPRTVAGEYTRDGKGIKGDGSAFGSKKVPGMTSEANVNAKYKSGMLKQLQLGGAYGSVKAPRKAVDWVLTRTRESLKERTGASAKGGPRSFHPAGFGHSVLKCQKYEVSKMGLGVCVWGDASTVGTVSSFELSGGEGTRPVNLKRTAELTAKVREDALVAKKG